MREHGGSSRAAKSGNHASPASRRGFAAFCHAVLMAALVIGQAAAHPIGVARHDVARIGLPAITSVLQVAAGAPESRRLPPAAGRVVLPGHRLAVLDTAQPASSPVHIPLSSAASAALRSMNLSLVLSRDDEVGFAAYLREVYDPASPHYRRFLDAAALADRYGPSEASYQALMDYLGDQGLTVGERSDNRLTMSVHGDRAAVERAFDVRIRDYRLGPLEFHANDDEPSLPAAVAARVLSVGGLSDLARPLPATARQRRQILDSCGIIGSPVGTLGTGLVGLINTPVGIALFIPAFFCALAMANYPEAQPPAAGPPRMRPRRNHHPRGGPRSTRGKPRRSAGAGASGVDATEQPVDGRGQTVAIVAFDTFERSDIVDYLDFIGADPGQIDRLERRPVNGGATAGANQDEVLLDVDTVMTVAPGARVVVYDAPFDGRITSYSTVFSAMIDDRVSIISNSWASCENQISTAEARGLDAVLETAAAAGISIFNATGDTGSTCLNGSADTASIPASSPNATAVGGTTLRLGPGFTYGGETWWDGSGSTPATGQGGFGVSRHFPRPAYQNGVSTAAMRSIPDVSTNADPASGAVICQAASGGCPSGPIYGGTSRAAPEWAGYAALLNQVLEVNVGNYNRALYPLAGSAAFHTPDELRSDFAHVGLGSPNLGAMTLALAGVSAGSVDLARSEVQYASTQVNGVDTFFAPVPADGNAAAIVAVTLLDSNSDRVVGQGVRLATNSPTAVVTALNEVSDVASGTSVFAVRDPSPGTVTVRATMVADGRAIEQSVDIDFGVPPAANAGINVFPTAVAADGRATASITVSLRDALGRPSPGKEVRIDQQGGRSTLRGPVPPVTDASGQIRFEASSDYDETVRYSAVVVTDGNLPVPGDGTVRYSGSVGNGCGIAPVAGEGYLAQPFATGFVARAFNFGNINNGCQGPSLAAFDAAGNLLVANSPTGRLYRFGPDGGVADDTRAVNSVPLNPGISSLAFGLDGRLYATQSATTGDFFSGAVIELDPSSGAVLRTVAANITCAGGLAVDPLSGDLFVDDSCAGAGSENPAIWRIANPASAAPLVSVYVVMPEFPNAPLAFAPDGTLYVWSAGRLYRVGGTGGPQPAAITALPGVLFTGLGLAIGRVAADGAVQSVFMTADGGIAEVDITRDPVRISRALISDVSGAFGALARGPDGCLYVSVDVSMLRLTDSGGGCTYTSEARRPSLFLEAPAVTPTPVQGDSRTITASARFGTLPAGSAVQFSVNGANPQRRIVRVDSRGEAGFRYQAIRPGDDAVVAQVLLDGQPVISNTVLLRWEPGTHLSDLSINATPQRGTVDVPLTVSAALIDLSAAPPAAVVGAEVEFVLGSGGRCTGNSDAQGVVRCVLIPGRIGSTTLTIGFAGRSALAPTTIASAFLVLAPAAVDALPVVTLAAAPTALILGTTTTLTWSSTDADACSASGGWTGARAVSGSETLTPATVGGVVYTLACSGPGGVTTSAATVTVNAAPVPPPRRKGGAFGSEALLLLGLLAFARRRRILSSAGQGIAGLR